MSILYKPHRELLEESMAAMKSFETGDEFLAYIVEYYASVMRKEVSVGDIAVKYSGHDDRIDWDLYDVLINGQIWGHLNRAI